MRLERRMRILSFAVIAAVLAVAAAAGGDGVELARAGLVFDGGRFVPGPYDLRVVATPEGAEVVVAGVRLDRLQVRPQGVREAAAVEPVPFETPPGATSLGQSGYSLYLSRLLRYRTGEDGFARALERVEDEARTSPLVRRVERLDDGLMVYDLEGTPYFVGAGPYLDPAPLTREQVLALARRTLEAYRALLDGGGAILHFEEVDLFLPRERVADVLVPSLRVLEDAGAPEETLRQRLAAYWSHEAIVEGLLRGRRERPELDAALAPYRAEAGR